MPSYPFSEAELSRAESELGVSFPAWYREWWLEGQGFGIELEGCLWFLHPVVGTRYGSRRELGVAGETTRARAHAAWPAGAIKIGFDGGGGCLVLRPSHETEFELGYWGGRHGAQFVSHVEGAAGDFNPA